MDAMAKHRDKMVFIINNASYERVVTALSLASVAAALDAKVSLLFTNAGIIRVKQGSADIVSDETSSWLRKQITSGIKKGTISRISSALRDIKELGGHIYACPAAMAFHNISNEELTTEVSKVCGMAELIMTEVDQYSRIIYV